MDDLNIFHVLSDAADNIGHGVQLISQNDIDSKTLICYLDGKQKFHYGFCYKNGSNLRVVTWENDEKTLKTVPKGSFVIAFCDNEVKTTKSIKVSFTREDFHFEWFEGEAKNNVEEELKSLINKKDDVGKIVEGLCSLTIQDLKEVDKKIKELKNA